MGASGPGASQRLAAIHQSEAWAEHEHLLGEFLPSKRRWKVPSAFPPALRTQEECASHLQTAPEKAEWTAAISGKIPMSRLTKCAENS